MSFSQDFIEKVRDANNLVDILSEYTSFKRTGGQHMGRCPLPGHNEKTPSFSVSEPKQVYHCFGCGKSGNIFDALRELRGFSFPESVEYLANRAGIAIPESDQKKSSNPDRDKKARQLKLNKIAAEFFHKTFLGLPASHPVKKYAESRGLSQPIVEEFRIGYAPDGWDGLKKYLDRIKAPVKLSESLGLLKMRSSKDGYYDLFRHRLMFSIRDHRGDFVGFGGRVLDKDQQPKYLNSPESDLFHKGKVFYGLFETAKHIRESDFVIVVEGYMDFLALYAAGVKNVVATLGTALTENHARLIKRFTQNVVVLFDGDKAGMNASERSLPVLLAEGLIPKGVVLPNGQDPDDFIRAEGAQGLRKLIAKAPELFIWQLDREMAGFRGLASDKVRVMDKLAPVLKAIPDSRLRSLYQDEVAQRIGVEPHLVATSVVRGASALAPAKSPVAQAVPNQTPPARGKITQEGRSAVSMGGEKVRLSGAPKAELFLLNVALMASEVWHKIWESEVVDEISHPGVQKMLVAGHEFCGQNPNKFDKLTAYLMGLTDTPKELAFHMSAPFQAMGPEEMEKMRADCIKQIHERFLKNKVREITLRMKSRTPEEQLQELEQIVNMKIGKRTSKKKTET